MNTDHHSTTPGAPRVLLLGLDDRPDEGLTVEESLEELGLLVETWGGEVVALVSQPRLRPHPAWYVGRGKLKEVEEAARDARADFVVADSELTPVQLRNMERELEVSVLDRTQVILEIFARRAHSREGKLEVELAQSVYALPRLAGKGLILSRLGGGIGTRGPGETKLEVDRRRLKDRIVFLRREIAEAGRHRAVQSRSRREALAPVASLVGYTNAGKSSLFNRLTGADALVEDRLFATLDPVVRKLELPNNQRILLSDTVGFIRKLPHHLVAAFKGTLDEVREADILIHVIDASNPAWPAQERAAERVLADIGAGETPVIFALNKVDRLEGGRMEALSSPEARELAREFKVVAVSALTGEGTDDLLRALVAEFAGRRRVFLLTVPYDQQSLLPVLHERGRIMREEYTGDGVLVEVELETILGRRFEAILAEPKERT
jgi:GTP-binding protein HflX